ncbi:hypothetical protein NLJ89_g9044 [Agrocybe chaxingu]|uniref:Uncharacterized protein n=1 Tax=Agrocybe chaxingu TaxID=84603 RepID=A0A9W8JTH0_9AGAR|nr:hypothetical protein NLJ89_g9044 [Agrocybe chaxingu]
MSFFLTSESSPSNSEDTSPATSPGSGVQSVDDSESGNRSWGKTTLVPEGTYDDRYDEDDKDLFDDELDTQFAELQSTQDVLTTTGDDRRTHRTTDTSVHPNTQKSPFIHILSILNIL